MKKAVLILLFFINVIAYTQETDEYYDFGMAAGITIYGERPKEYDPGSIDAYVLNQLNGFESDRKQFIEIELLEKAGFRRTGNVKYRESTTSEKASSVVHGIFHAFSFGIVPKKSFFEIEYDKLPKGKYYTFESIVITSEYKNVSPEILIVMELEYKLQIEFFFGIVIQDNIKYYTDENINKFEELILKLPDYPESIITVKTRYFGELLKIKNAYERHKNPSENHKKAMENLGNDFIITH
jgi:hypothetical protein